MANRRKLLCNVASSIKGAAVLAVTLLLYLGSLSSAVKAQDYFTGDGAKIPTAPDPAEAGYVETSNGSVQLEIPLGSYAQRGSTQPITYTLVYNGNIWQNLGAGWDASGYLWGNQDTMGWLGVWPNDSYSTFFGASYSLVYEYSGYNLCAIQYENFNWKDPGGTIHSFPIQTLQRTSCGTAASTGNALATDSSGYHMYVTNYNQATVYAPDGALVAQPYTGTTDSHGNMVEMKDANGNYLSSNGGNYITSGTDTAGRNQGIGVQLLNSQNQSMNYSITWSIIYMKTDFGQSGVGECSGSGCMGSVLQSLTLPDGSTYTFQYDCDSTGGNPACGSPGGQSAYYGELISMALPTGGTVTYGYTNFKDAYGNENRWLTSRTSAGGTWTYAPTVLTTCASQQSVGCTEQVTETKPSGERTVTTFTLNNGTWPTEVQSYDNAGSLLTTVNNTYDFSQTCPLQGCSGNSYIRPLSQATTVSIPGGSTLTRQTTYNYDSPMNGNVTATREWGFYPGSFPSVPDKATYINYLQGETNIINKPISVTVCNNSGSSSSCSGAGGVAAQTTIAYDSYGSTSVCGGLSGLKSVTGIMNHDDADFSASFTSRGNPTQVSEWTNGSSYITTNFFYDTTGQILASVDSKGNPTCFGYSDNFYTDEKPPSAYSPAYPTNSYLTSVIVPLSSGTGTETYGYYYGSGQPALDTDPNGVTISSHYLDPMSRPTETDNPTGFGWSLSQYTSPNLVDSYIAVWDTSASPGCTGCKHEQTVLDDWGRKVSEKLVNDPACEISADTNYDPDGRVQSVSHPYCSQSSPYYVFEQFTYDGLDRQIQVTHPDANYSQVAYGPAVVSVGGLTSQQGSPSTYGYGYPIVTVDEAGKQRQEWLNGFGRVIEVDEPGGNSGSSSGPAAGTGSATASGNDQYSAATSATSGTAVISIGGTEDYIEGNQCYYQYNGPPPCPYNTYDYGTVSITVAGHTDNYEYGEYSTDATVAEGLAAAINGDGSAYVTASGNSSGMVTLTSKVAGSASDYALSVSSASGDPSLFGGASFFPAAWCSASETAYCPTLAGGKNAQSATYDSGTVWVTVNDLQASVTYTQSSTAQSIAAALASGLSASDSPVTATASGSTITITATQTGLESNYSLTSGSMTSLPGQFSSPSFAIALSGPNLTGGTDGTLQAISSPQTTNYTYDALGNLTGVYEGAQTRTFVYDGLSRPTSVTTPEGETDTYSYTSSGSPCSGDASSVCSKTDARGIVTTYAYNDPLNRLTGISFTGGTGSIGYAYDSGGTGAYALGRLTQMTDPSGSETYTYNQMGWVTQVQKAISGTIYTTNYNSFNEAGELTEATYPSGRVVQQYYDNVGKLCEVASSTSSCTTATNPYVTIDPIHDWDPSGNLLGLAYGNGICASYVFSPPRLELTNLSYFTPSSSGNCQSTPSTTWFGLNYSYQYNQSNCPNGTTGNNGQIQCIADTVQPGRTVGYGYDLLGRLSAATTAGSSAYPQWGLSWTYDRYGNRTAQTVTAGSWGSSSVTVNAATNQIDGFTYDNSGNLTVEPMSPLSPRNMAYDATGCETSFSGPGGSATYTCDGNGVRVKKAVQGGTTTVYVYSGSTDIAEYDNGAAVTSPSREFIYADGKLAATLTNTSGTITTAYDHADHLSVRLITDGTTGSPTYGQMIGQQGTDAWGEAWYSGNATTEFLYTTYQRDQESGLDYAMARYYDSGLGRFCSADPVGGDPNDPQSWNRYLYSRDDPVNMSDPSGQHSFWYWLAQIFEIVAAILVPPLISYIEAGGAAGDASFGWLTALESATAPAAYEAATHGGNEGGPGPEGGAQNQSGVQPNAPAPAGQQPSTDATLRLNCIQNALGNIDPNVRFRYQSGSENPWGGHMNGEFKTAPVSPLDTQKISQAVQIADEHKLFPKLLPGVDHGARFPTNPSVGGSLHIPTGDVTISGPNDAGNETVTATGHVDTYNPRSGAGGALGHVFHDVLWGQIKQLFRGDLDKRCAAQ